MKAACPWCRRVCGTWEPGAPMAREKRQWRPHKRESPKAGHRDGVARSSAEGAGMARERRGDIVPLSCEVNQAWEEPRGESNAM
jgi:hypothetical protein